MVRMVRKSKTLCITEEVQGQSKHVYEFQYHDMPASQTSWNPNMDILETSKDLIIIIEAAGLDEKKLQLNAIENRLVLSGERRLDISDSVVRYHQLEILFMPFQKTIILPGAIDEKNVKAQYKNGMLTIRVPKQFFDEAQ